MITLWETFKDAEEGKASVDLFFCPITGRKTSLVPVLSVALTLSFLEQMEEVHAHLAEHYRDQRLFITGMDERAE